MDASIQSPSLVSWLYAKLASVLGHFRGTAGSPEHDVDSETVADGNRKQGDGDTADAPVKPREDVQTARQTASKTVCLLT